MVKNLLVPDDIGGIGTVTHWTKKEGEKFEKGEMLLEVETRKAVIQIDAPESGTILRITAKAGAPVVSRTALALYAAEGEEIPAALLGPAAPGTLFIRLLSEGKAVTDADVSVGGQKLLLTKEGEFTIGGLAPGQYSVHVSAVGFLEKIFVFTLGEAETARHELEMFSTGKQQRKGGTPDETGY